MPLREELRAVVDDLAARNVFVGTSSWKYEGWIGRFYDEARYLHRGRLAKSRFEAECLREYAEVFRSVCVDAGFYRFPTPDYARRLADQVPDGFRFSFKVTDEITMKRFPRLPRHGDRAGAPNTNFLNARLFTEAFLGPLEPVRGKVGVLILEFSRFHKGDFARGREFVEALDGFLGAIPRGWQYAVELRNPSLLHPEYFAVLARHGVAHVFNSWTAMPPVSAQAAMPGAFPADFFAARFLLKPGRKYAEAVSAFAPYESAREPLAAERAALRDLAARRTPAPSFVYVNNRLEGNALDTIASIAREAAR